MVPKEEYKGFPNKMGLQRENLSQINAIREKEKQDLLENQQKK